MAKIVCTVIMTVWAIFDAQWFFLARKVDNGDQIWCDYNYDNAPASYFKFYANFNACMYSFIPVTLIFILNVSIITKLIIARMRSNSDSSQNTLSKTAVNSSIMLLSVSVTFLIHTVPFSISWVMRKVDDTLHPMFSWFYAITLFLFYSNHSVNAILYCLVAPKFRREMLRLLCCCQGNKIRPETSVTENGSK